MTSFVDEPAHLVQVRDSIRRFVEREMPREAVRRWDRERMFPREVFHRLAATGVCGLTVAEEYGGAGRDIVAAVTVIDELARRGTALAGPYIHCAFYSGLNVSENGSPAQQRALLPRIARGELLFAYGLSEPDVGGDLASVAMTARRSADGRTVVLNGTKRWCTGARVADYILCLVRSDPDAPRYRNLSLVLVPPGLRGITIVDIDHLGLRYAATTDVIFEEVGVPIDDVLGGPEGWNQGWRMLAGPALDVEKLEITAVAYGLSEPDVGGDLASVAMTARRSADGRTVVLNGTKRWCTGARVADYILCLVRSDPEAPRYRNLSLVLVPPGLPGITIVDVDHLGLRYAATSDVIFEDVGVPIDDVLGGPEGWNQGWRMLAGPALDVEKLEIAAVAYGIAAAAVDDAWRYAQERQQFGKPICAHQSVRHALVEARTKLQACRHLLYHAAWLADQSRPCSVETSMAKLFIAETAVEIVLGCQRILGAYGCAEGYDMERYVRDICVMPIVGGSSNMQRNNIAARLRLPE